MSASEADLAEARELLAVTGLSPYGVDFAVSAVAAALAERERRGREQALRDAANVLRGAREAFIAHGNMPGIVAGAIVTLVNEADALKAAREATK